MTNRGCAKSPSSSSSAPGCSCCVVLGVPPWIAEQRLRERRSHNEPRSQREGERVPGDHVALASRRQGRDPDGVLRSPPPASSAVSWTSARLMRRPRCSLCGLLTVRNASLRKRGNELTGTATVTKQGPARRRAVSRTTSSRSHPGTGRLALRGSATLFGVTATADTGRCSGRQARRRAENPPVWGVRHADAVRRSASGDRERETEESANSPAGSRCQQRPVFTSGAPPWIPR